MKHRLTITIDEGLYKGLGLNAKNVSGYINELLQREFIGTQREGIVKSIKTQVIDGLINNAMFIDNVVEAVQERTKQNW